MLHIWIFLFSGLPLGVCVRCDGLLAEMMLKWLQLVIQLTWLTQWKPFFELRYSTQILRNQLLSLTAMSTHWLFQNYLVTQLMSLMKAWIQAHCLCDQCMIHSGIKVLFFALLRSQQNSKLRYRLWMTMIWSLSKLKGTSEWTKPSGDVFVAILWDGKSVIWIQFFSLMAIFLRFLLLDLVGLGYFVRGNVHSVKAGLPAAYVL